MKNFFGDKDVEAVTQRLDRLTQEEARTTAAQTLGVVCGLVQNMQRFMDGEHTPEAQNPPFSEHLSLKTAKHPSTGCRKLLVRFVDNNEQVSCLTERQKAFTRRRRT
jgi:hypothetical protein